MPIPDALAPFRQPPYPGLIPGDLPTDVREFYAVTNGLEISPLDTEVLSFEEATRYAEALSGHPLSEYYGLLPVTESNNSNPFCVILGPRLQGAILLVNHDDDASLCYSSLAMFLGALAHLVEAGGDDIDDLAPQCEFPLNLVMAADTVVGDPDLDATILISAMSACSSTSLVPLLKSDDMWVREAAAIQIGRRVYTEAYEALKELSAAGDGQDNRAARTSLATLRSKAR